MITSQQLRTITDMRKRADELLRLVSAKKEPIGILKNNRLKAYLVDSQTLESLESLLEDLLDRRLATDRLNAPKKDFLELETFWKNQNLPK